MTIISTTSDIELTKYNSKYLAFEKIMPGLPEEIFLQHSNQWYVGSKDGCSCGFRHLMTENYPDLGFAEPVDWFEEDQEDIEATIELVQVFKDILSNNSKLDCVDAWTSDSNESPKLSGDIKVNLAEVSENSFRLVENYRFELKN
jgi:hypothetical protein